MKEKPPELKIDSHLMYIGLLIFLSLTAVIIASLKGMPAEIPSDLSVDLTLSSGTLTILWIYYRLTGIE